EKAVESALVQETYLDGIVSSLYIPLHFFYYSLALLLSYSNAGRKKQKKYLKLVRKNQKKLKKWAGHAPMNYLHRYDLVEAELARVTGDAMRAMDFYRKAIRGARDNGFIPDEGIGAECAARFYYEHGDIDVARGYMARAWSCYSKWGALGKLKHLEETYPDLVLTGPAAAPAAETGKREQMGAATETAELSTDLSRVMETSRAISGEIVLSKLLTGLMRLTMENAGVERGCIILEREGELFVEAEDRENAEESVVLLLSIPVNDHPGVCSAIVRYVKNNAERVLLNNGPGEGDFADDPYIRKNTPQSLLCFPIINRGTVTGIIYLESRMEQGIFNPEREDMLRAISSQVALSIDNARLYGNLERKNARLMELDKLKDEFLANTSHELRTPLNGIIGLAESMVGTPGTELSREAAANCMLIAASGKRLANLVNDILDFSKLKNRDMELKQGPVDIRSITDVVLDLCSALMGGKNLVLENTIDRDIPFVRGDENRLQQVFFNLVGNAVKFTEEGSITVSAEQESGMIRITVADTGIGIPGERINGIFESFEQADGSIEREYGGTGIGLSIVKRLVELHEGRIEVESAVGAGSRFMIILPVWKGKEKPEPEKIPAVETFLPVPGEAAREGMADSAASAGKNGYLLVVDDDPVNVRVVWSYLRTEGYGIETVPNGPAALEKIRDKGPGEQYDLVLLDLMMPKMSGYEVCRILRKSMSLFELPVIMLTARNGVEDLTAGFEAGVNDYLAKPFTKKELLSRVETLVTLKRTVKDHKEARYKLLQERMNPHFLFNALNTINAYIYSRPETAGIALQKLSQNYRFLMNQSLKSVIFFTDEWEFVRNYLDMEELRFGYRLSTEMIINGDFENIKIPPLCIQPLVENSLKHGLRNKKGKGYVRITARRDGNQVIVEVIDNGVGLTKEDIYSRSLGNILKRLKHYYPDAWLEARNRDEEGVRVIVGFSPGGGDGPDENS
ncbi:MAG: response regulator, partial [bacterium]|nr:response regulator [bacterium]